MTHFRLIYAVESECAGSFSNDGSRPAHLLSLTGKAAAWSDPSRRFAVGRLLPVTDDCMFDKISCEAESVGRGLRKRFISGCSADNPGRYGENSYSDGEGQYQGRGNS